jgi:hypothetical protein
MSFFGSWLRSFAIQDVRHKQARYQIELEEDAKMYAIKQWEIKETTVRWKLKHVVSDQQQPCAKQSLSEELTLSMISNDSSAALHPGRSFGSVTERSPLNMLFGHWMDLYASFASIPKTSAKIVASAERHTSRGLVSTLASGTSMDTSDTERLSSKFTSPSTSSVIIVSELYI